MKSDIGDIYRSAWAFALACPLLFLIPALVEFAQHVVEWRIGMYDSLAGAKAAADNAERLQFGFAKTLALLLPGYWFTRYILFGGDAAKARRIEMPAIALWLVLFGLGALQQWWALFGPPFVGLFGLAGETGRWSGYAISLLWAVIGIYFTAWVVAWPLGNAAIGPLRSAKIMSGCFWRTVGLILAAILPLMILHYILGYAALLTPVWLDWLLLSVDAVAVGFLALMLAGSNAVAARHAARVKGVDLTAGARQFSPDGK